MKNINLGRIYTATVQLLSMQTRTGLVQLHFCTNKIQEQTLCCLAPDTTNVIQITLGFSKITAPVSGRDAIIEGFTGITRCVQVWENKHCAWAECNTQITIAPSVDKR